MLYPGVAWGSSKLVGSLGRVLAGDLGLACLPLLNAGLSGTRWCAVKLKGLLEGHGVEGADERLDCLHRCCLQCWGLDGSGLKGR